MSQDKFWLNSNWWWFDEIKYPSAKARKASHWCWFKQSFILPEEFKGKQVFLKLNGVYFQYFVWINGKIVGANADGTIPYAINITDAVKIKGRNKLNILVGDSHTLAKDAPHGAMGRFQRGLMDNVIIYGVNKCHITDIFVKTSYRKKQIDVDLEIANSNKGVKAAFEVSSANGKSVPLQFKRLSGKQSWRASWKKPHLWSLHDPHLYYIKVKLISPEGKLIDEKRLRFGFREFWVEGPAFYLNGQKTFLKQQFTHIGNYIRAFRMQGGKRRDVTADEYIKTCKVRGINALRYQCQPFPRPWVEAADRNGIFILAGTLLSHGPVSDKSAQHVHNLVKAYRNHPSIVIWSLNNEFVHWVYPRVKEVSAFLNRIEDDVNKLDPTRPAQHSGYGEFSPKQDVINIHYPAPRDKVLIPNCFHWMRSGKYINDIYKANPWKRDKPLMIGEQLLPWEGELWTMIGGDRIYKEPHYNLKKSKILAIAMGQAYRMMVENARVGGLSMVSVLSGRNLSTQWWKEKAYILDPQDGFIMQRGLRFWSSENIKLDYFTWNDGPGKLSGKLQYTIDAGFSPGHGSIEINLKQGDTQKDRIELKAPETSRKIIRAELDIKLKDAIAQRYPVGIFPNKYNKISRQGILFLSNKKSETEMMKNYFNLNSKIVDAIKKETLGDIRAAVISGTLLAVLKPDDLKRINNFCKAGGRIILLALPGPSNSGYKWMPIPLSVSAIPLTITFPRVYSRLLFKNILKHDLRFWQDNNIVAQYSFNIPASGNFVPLCDAGSSSGMSLSSLLEIRSGKGLLVASSYSFIKKMFKDPAAMLLFSNLLEYIQKIRPVPFKKTIIALNSESEELQQIIKKFKPEADFCAKSLAETELTDKQLLITNGNSLSKLLNIDNARAFLKKGGVIYIHLLRKKQKTYLEKLTGVKISFEKYKSSSYIPDLRNKPLVRGLSISDLDWGDSRKQAFAPIADFCIKIDKKFKGKIIQGFKKPGLIVELACHGGRIVVDQTKWDNEDLKTTRAQRFGSMLLSNLGMKMHGVPYNVLKNVKFKILDISSKFNSVLCLDSAKRMTKYFNRIKNGKGNVQGLKALKRGSGSLTFEYDKIPFKLKTKGKRCITVTCPDGKYDQLTGVDNIELPRGDTLIESIYFFHLSRINWRIKLQRFIKIGSYRVNYVDGSTIDIPIERQINIATYRRNYPDGLPKAKMAMLLHDARNNKACLFCTSWRNPFPGKKIRSIDLVPGKNLRMQPFLFAVTLEASDYKYE